jgi:hypothetical protein
MSKEWFRNLTCRDGLGSPKTVEPQGRKREGLCLLGHGILVCSVDKFLPKYSISLEEDSSDMISPLSSNHENYHGRIEQLFQREYTVV